MPGAPDPAFLSASQRRTVGFAVTLAAICGSAALIILSFIVLGRLLVFFSSVLWPLAVAGVFALILRPVVELLIRRLKLRRPAAVVLIYGIVSLLLGGALFLLLPPLIDQLLDFITFLPTLRANGSLYVETNYPQWVSLIKRQLANPTVRQIADAGVAEGRSLLSHTLPSLRAAGGGLLGIGAFVAHVAIIPVYLFFFLLSTGDPTRNLPGHLPFLNPDLRADLVFLLREFIGIVESFFRGQLLIGLIMGALLALGFTLIGLKFGLFIGLVVGVLNIVPYLGSIIGIAITIPLAFLQPGGGWTLVGLVLLIKIIVQTVEGWFLTPKIMGERTGLHPVIIIVAIFFWGTAFDGILGMLLAIPLTAFFVIAWRLARYKYFKKT
ncbi:MAG: AI-2E family transporter [Undibacterium sp.]|nr:AI-2E family transporter [Opitutaceae bacterium]